MNFTKTKIPDVLIFEPKVFGDERGFFFESFNKKIFDEAVGGGIDFVQDNQSKSMKGVLRGLHYQTKNTQAKLVRVISGAVYDVVVDLRKESSTYGNWFGIELSAKNKKQLWVPKGFAHGFYVLEDNTEFAYKCSDYYNPKYEEALFWNDNTLNISWPFCGDMEPIVSIKDNNGLSFKDSFQF